MQPTTHDSLTQQNLGDPLPQIVLPDYLEVSAWSPSGEYFAYGLQSESHPVKVMKVGDDIDAFVLPGEDINWMSGGELKHLAWSPDGHTLAGMFADGTLRMWAINLRLIVGVVDAHEPGAASYEVAWSPNGKQIASVSMDEGEIRLWDAKSLSPIGDPIAWPSAHLQWSPMGWLASPSTDGRISIWDLRY